jgi:hypothetical protein
LTLKALAITALGSSTLTIAASGDSLQAKATTTLQVIAPPAVHLALSSTSLAMQSTATLSFVATITPQGAVTPEANLAGVAFQVAGLPAGVTAAWSAPALTAAGTIQSTLKLTGSKTAGNSTGKLSVMGSVKDAATGTVYSEVQQATLTVTVAHTLSVAIAAPAVSTSKGKSVSNAVTVATGGTFQGAVTLSISGLPASVTAKWSQNPLTPNASTGQGTASITFTAASTAPPLTVNAVVTAIGGGVTTTKTVTVQVLASSATVGGRLP